MSTESPSSQREWLQLFSNISSLLHVPPTRTSQLPELDAHSTARLIDHTLLTPTATSDQISVVCAEAREHHFRAVCLRPDHVVQAKRELSGSDVAAASVVGFPSDDTAPSFTTDQKIAEAKNAIADGAVELDMVLDYETLREAALSSDDEEVSAYTSVYKDILAVRRVVPEPILLKVIFETSQLTDEDISRASVICCLAGADFVKTSTGFRGHGATVEAVQLMRTVCDVCKSEGLTNKRVQVKASGGIRTIDDVRKMVSVGADRIGASAGVAIMNGLNENKPSAPENIADTITAEY
jgi:deoxyribose-phosphate aldolase